MSSSDAPEAEAHLARARLPAGAEGRRARGGQGRDHLRDRGRGARGAQTFFDDKRFGATEVVLEEFLEGEELSLLALCDGERAIPLAPAQDYKRIGEGDEGPNTGGMGSYSPVPGSTTATRRRSRSAVHQPVVDEMRRRGTPYHGVLYAGLMITEAGPEGARVQLPLRRPRDAGGAAAAALGPARPAGPLDPARRPRGGRAGVVAGLGGHRRARLARLSRVVVEGRRDRGLRSIDSLDTEIFHAGHAPSPAASS